ncbi:hypothetical protein [Deinococcus ruber]|uniref:Uncharacterized protein n=1 Tax=Deinococcus ruber TaxID=1848197 RepID=A0A918BVZ0_9DEIO|nr:hypothetical protein [Deinococcus ruber]GGQ94956.1 hypothetical protein GCM10008957_04030 [Deinococcus ruber]
MNGRFKLLRQTKGRCHFAAVSVSAVASNTSPHHISILLNPQQKIEPERIHEEWRQACIKGVKTFFSIYPEASSKYSVVITEILATEVDTEAADLEISAYCAAFQAFFPSVPLPVLQSSDAEGWHAGG